MKTFRKAFSSKKNVATAAPPPEAAATTTTNTEQKTIGYQYNGAGGVTTLKELPSGDELAAVYGKSGRRRRRSSASNASNDHSDAYASGSDYGSTSGRRRRSQQTKNQDLPSPPKASPPPTCGMRPAKLLVRGT